MKNCLIQFANATLLTVAALLGCDHSGGGGFHANTASSGGDPLEQEPVELGDAESVKIPAERLAEFEENQIAAIKVLMDGRVFLNDRPITTPELADELLVYAEVGGIAWYYREQAERAPPNEGMLVVEAIHMARLPIRRSNQPDFSDVMIEQNPSLAVEPPPLVGERENSLLENESDVLLNKEGDLEEGDLEEDSSDGNENLTEETSATTAFGDDNYSAAGEESMDVTDVTEGAGDQSDDALPPRGSLSPMPEIPKAHQ